MSLPSVIVPHFKCGRCKYDTAKLRLYFYTTKNSRMRFIRKGYKVSSKYQAPAKDTHIYSLVCLERDVKDLGDDKLELLKSKQCEPADKFGDAIKYLDKKKTIYSNNGIAVCPGCHAKIKNGKIISSSESLHDKNRDPVQLQIMNVDQRIRDENIQEVTSTFIRESSSQEFHPQGLYSERIFGQIATPERLVTFGFINLRCSIFHPRVYKIITRLKGLYGEIIAGKSYGIYSKEDKDFVRAIESEPGAGTGITFFLKYFKDIDFGKSASLTRNTKIEVLEKYRSVLLMNKCLVLPAGLRDVKNEDGRDVVDDINKIYSSLINLSRALPVEGTTSTMYDSVKYMIQKKVAEITDYIHDIMSDKNGFLQSKYGARAIALGTRNVISATDTAKASPSDIQYIKSDESAIPLFQSMKAFQPMVSHELKDMFFNTTFNDGAARVALIDPKTLSLVYVDMATSEKDKYLSSDGISDLITSYRNPNSRHQPFIVRDDEKKPYYLRLIYRYKDSAFMVMSKSDMKSACEKMNLPFVEANLLPMTRAELFYFATYHAVTGKHVTITRYPITGGQSIYPSKVHLVTTDPSEVITLRLPFNPDYGVTLPHWPIKDKASVDSTTLHPSCLAGLGGDHDGDTISVNSLLSEEANEECAAHLNSPGSAVSAKGTLVVGLNTDVCKLSFYNLSRIPVKQ